MTDNPQDPFAAIRPYNDAEVKGVVDRLLENSEFIDALTRFRFPRAYGLIGSLLRPVVRTVLKRQLAVVNDIESIQQVIAGYMQQMIDRTTGALSFSGVENLKPGGAYLFISNHRDIAMDPAFVNWGLFQNGLNTVRIAIGDNLLRKPYVSDLMRLNKSFIVNRSAKGREKLTALLQLSAYINHSIAEGCSVWIAQREGRAKDGDDKTDPAILKMLYVSQKKNGSFAEVVKRLNIVPVSISYEYDPCDAAKARELKALDTDGSYEKSQFEDIDSIARGITGYKGDVHVAFGAPLTGDYETAEALAEAIDHAIYSNYRLHASNRLAAGEVAGISPEKQQQYQQRLDAVPEAEHPWFERMYSTPVANQRRVTASESHE